MAVETILVIAPKGLACPKELSRETIGDAAPVLVPNTSYYRRCIGEGSLLSVETKPKRKTDEQKTSTKKGS